MSNNAFAFAVTAVLFVFFSLVIGLIIGSGSEPEFGIETETYRSTMKVTFGELVPVPIDDGVTKTTQVTIPVTNNTDKIVAGFSGDIIVSKGTTEVARVDSDFWRDTSGDALVVGRATVSARENVPQIGYSLATHTLRFEPKQIHYKSDQPVATRQEILR